MGYAVLGLMFFFALVTALSYRGLYKTEYKKAVTYKNRLGQIENHFVDKEAFETAQYKLSAYEKSNKQLGDWMTILLNKGIIDDIKYPLPDLKELAYLGFYRVPGEKNWSFVNYNHFIRSKLTENGIPGKPVYFSDEGGVSRLWQSLDQLLPDKRENRRKKPAQDTENNEQQESPEEE